jgi:hypothetical protein
MTKRADIDKDRLGVAGILLATLLLAGPATATPVTLAETAADSEAVIYGEIVARSFSRDRGGMIWTNYKLRVDSMFRGEFDGSLLEFNCIGGSDGDESIVVEGIPGFIVGEQILLFYDDDDPQCPVANGEWGVLFRKNSNRSAGDPCSRWSHRGISATRGEIARALGRAGA